MSLIPHVAVITTLFYTTLHFTTPTLQLWDGKTCAGTGFIFDPENIAQIPGGAKAFNPPTVLPANTMAHGGPMNAYKTSAKAPLNTRMAGDLGNVLSSVNGQASVYIMDPELMLSGANSIVGHRY
jgi:hypothetical protein